MLNLNDFKKAHKSIAPYISYTPLIHSNALSNDLDVYLKLECLQVTGSFKLRGAINKLLNLSSEQKNKGVIAVSTGNHGKGVAHAAKRLGIQSTIFMSSMVPQHRRKASPKRICRIGPKQNRCFGFSGWYRRGGPLGKWHRFGGSNRINCTSFAGFGRSNPYRIVDDLSWNSADNFLLVLNP